MSGASTPNPGEIEKISTKPNPLTNPAGPDPSAQAIPPPVPIVIPANATYLIDTSLPADQATVESKAAADAKS